MFGPTIYIYRIMESDISQSRPKVSQDFITAINSFWLWIIYLRNQLLHGRNSFEKLPPLELADFNINVSILGSLNIIFIFKVFY